jgi:hypothetical protein
MIKQIIISIVVVGVLFGGISIWHRTFYKPDCPPGFHYDLANCKIPAVQVVSATTTDWKTYKNEQYGFEIKYPQTWWIDYFLNKDWKNWADNTISVGNGVESNLKCQLDLSFEGRVFPNVSKMNLYQNSNERKECDDNLTTILSTFKFTK